MLVSLWGEDPIVLWLRVFPIYLQDSKSIPHRILDGSLIVSPSTTNFP
jgi:hypothetical protein